MIEMFLNLNVPYSRTRMIKTCLTWMAVIVMHILKIQVMPYIFRPSLKRLTPRLMIGSAQPQQKSPQTFMCSICAS